MMIKEPLKHPIALFLSLKEDALIHSLSENIASKTLDEAFLGFAKKKRFLNLSITL